MRRAVVTIGAGTLASLLLAVGGQDATETARAETEHAPEVRAESPDALAVPSVMGSFAAPARHQARDASSETALEAAVPATTETTVPDTSVQSEAQRLAQTPEPITAAVGYANAGRLEASQHVTPLDSLQFVPWYLDRGNYFGTEELVSMITAASDEVYKAVEPSARLQVGELSAEHGGRISRHRSHQNGRDVDLGFYMLDAEGLPVETHAFVHFTHGLSVEHDGAELSFDAERNWRLVSALLLSEHANVQYIFVAGWLKRALLEEAERQSADEDLIFRAQRVLMQPPGAAPHDDHFHVRIYCPQDDDACFDRPPLWPWLR